MRANSHEPVNSQEAEKKNQILEEIRGQKRGSAKQCQRTRQIMFQGGRRDI